LKDNGQRAVDVILPFRLTYSLRDRFFLGDDDDDHASVFVMRFDYCAMKHNQKYVYQQQAHKE
jgi:hypothetical protein